MSNQEIPKIKKVADVGKTPFTFIEKTESILQGWDNTIKKTIYLFKTDGGKWGYFDKESRQIIEITHWRDKAAWIAGHWVVMSLYHRVHLAFTQPISYSNWDSVLKKEYKESTEDGIVTITDTAYKSLIEQMNGRDENDIYKFSFTSRKLKGRQVTYVDKAIWVGSSQ